MDVCGCKVLAFVCLYRYIVRVFNSISGFSFFLASSLSIGLCTVVDCRLQYTKVAVCIDVGI